MRSLKLFGILGLSLIAGVASAQTVILGFESGNVLANGSPEAQSHNSIAPRGSAQNSDLAFVSQGTGSVQITNTWRIPGNSMVDEWITGRPTQICWAIRAHYGGTTPISTAYTQLEIDIYNNGTEALDAAIILHDGAYKRGPFTSLTPGVWTKVTWDLSVPGESAVTAGASGPLNRAATVFRGVGFHLGPTQTPTSADVEVYVDNLVGISAQSDTIPPENPVLLKLEQGSAPGKVKPTWAANPVIDDVAKYTIHYLDAAAWQRTAQNRINTNVIAASVDVNGAASTTGEIDVAVDAVSYIMITATDAATPVANTSARSNILAVRLNSDGSVPENLVVLDNKRYTSVDTNYINLGYEHMIAYYGVALSTNSEAFVSAISDAVANGDQTLTADEDQIVIWSAGVDGNTQATALAVDNVNALTSFVTGGGNLLLTGANVGDGLFSDDAPVELSDFAANVLKADLETTNTASKDITGLGSTASFSAVGDIATGTDIFYAGAGSVTFNDAYSNLSGAFAAGTNGPGSAIIYTHDTMLFGFGLEQVRDPAADTPNAAGATAGAAKRAALLGAALGVLRAGAPPTAVSDWSLYH